MITEQAKQVLKMEAEAILSMAERIGSEFEQAVDLICNSGGRLIVAGIGKSGIIGKKITATLNSTGTQSLFLHPVEAMHGDLGMVCATDVFLALSNSGETKELNLLLPIIRRIGCKIISFTGNLRSTLANHSDIVIDVGVECEACEIGAPTTSTTAMLAMGDALAVVLIHKKDFNAGDFKKFHPGGALGQRLLGKIKDIMLGKEFLPIISEDTDMGKVVAEMDRLGFGVVFVTDAENKLSGIITDGDLRRMLVNKKPIFEMIAKNVMTRNPRTMTPDSPAYDALNLMEKHQITVLPITDDFGIIKGILHLHDILGKGEFKF